MLRKFHLRVFEFFFYWISICLIHLHVFHYLFFLKQLSQFWYDDHTANILAKEALIVAGENGRFV